MSADKETESSHALLIQALQKSDKSAVDKAIEYAVAVSLSAIAVPKGDEIHALSKMNPRTPVFFSVWLAYEKRMNNLLGNLRVTGKPLYKPMTFFSDVVSIYMKITPSTGKSPINRAEAVLDAMKAGALQKQPTTGHPIPEPRSIEPPRD